MFLMSLQPALKYTNDQLFVLGHAPEDVRGH
jgi:hypothetical protein